MARGDIQEARTSEKRRGEGRGRVFWLGWRRMCIEHEGYGLIQLIVPLEGEGDVGWLVWVIHVRFLGEYKGKDKGRIREAG